jgi:predicted transcriptional regulator YdeE
MQLLNNFTKNPNEYYGVIWYTKLHESYKYLIGQELKNKTEKFEIKIIPEGQYAYSKFSQNFDAIEAWTDFYEKGIPEIGHEPIEKNDIAFEYYPNGLGGDYELWSLVKKNA